MGLRETSKATSDLWKAGGCDLTMVKDSSSENLKQAIANVTSEFSKLFPRFKRDAEKVPLEVKSRYLDIKKPLFGCAHCVRRIEKRFSVKQPKIWNH